MENFRKDAVITGIGKIGEHRAGIGVLDFNFLGGSMGSVMGEKLTRLFEKCATNTLPVIIISTSGGARVYEEMRCSDAQHRALLPAILKLARKHRMRVRLDCSYTPMVTHHKVKPRLMRWLAIYGCAGGDLLVGAKATGALTARLWATPTTMAATVPASPANRR